MDNPGEIMRLCRLCLVKDQVNIPIFDEQGDIRQIFLKISSCLPVKVSKEDQLPKSICDGCSNKLDLLYEFRNSSVNAEKALLSWVSQAIKDVDETVGVATQPVAKPSETQVKEETLEECHAPLVHSNDSMDAQESAAFDENSAKEESDEPPPPKRARRTAAVKAQINIAPDSDDEDDDDLDIDAEPLTKIEDESDESDGDEKDDPSYPDVPGTSADDQPGPSGVGKDGVEAPKNNVKIKLRPKREKLTRLKKEQACELLDSMMKDEIDDEFVEHGVSEYIPPTKQKKTKACVIECDKCFEIFLTKTLLNKHKKNDECIYEDIKSTRQGKKRPAQNKEENVEEHQKKSRCRVRAWPCKYCKETFDTQRLLKAHKKIHKAPLDEQDEEEPTYKFDELQDLYICAVCSAEFQEKSEAEEHIKLHQKVMSCKECGDSFKSPLDFGIHTSKHDPEQKIRCPLCPYVCSNPNPYRFKVHINYVHLKKFPFYCKICSKGFKHFKTFNEHENTHTGTKPYVCVVCNKKFTYQKYLHVHQVRNHQVGTTGNKIENQCRICNRYFFKPEALNDHVEVCFKKKKEKSDTPAKAFLCDTCGQTFTEKAKLLEHLRVHKGDLPFVCTWCGKKFPVKAYLKNHERVHTGEKPYSCEFCGKRFGHHAPFRVHRRTHTGERPYVCDFCNKGFTTNQGLKLHKRNCPDNQFKMAKPKDTNISNNLTPIVILQEQSEEKVFGEF